MQTESAGTFSACERGCSRCGSLPHASACALAAAAAAAAAAPSVYSMHDLTLPPHHTTPLPARRKQLQVESQLNELGMEALDERLQSATQVGVDWSWPLRLLLAGVQYKLSPPTIQHQQYPTPTLTPPIRHPQNPVNPPYRLSRLISQITSSEGRAAIVVEIARPSPSATSVQLGVLAKRAVAAVSCRADVVQGACARISNGFRQPPALCIPVSAVTIPLRPPPMHPPTPPPHTPQQGADALVVRIDTEDTPEGNKDIFAVTQAVRVPVLTRDWYIHPLQIVEAKEAGAAGLVGVIGQVGYRGGGCRGWWGGGWWGGV